MRKLYPVFLIIGLFAGICLHGFSVSSQSSVPPIGSILIITSGACPSGYTEVSALNGKTLLGTLNANGDIGATGGSDTITPAGSVSQPTFTGISVTSSAVSAGTPAVTNSAPTFTVNAVVAASTNSGTKLVTGNTSTGVSPVTTA